MGHVPDLARWWPDRPGISPTLRAELEAAYAAPDRRYHDLRHLHEVLLRIDELEAAGAAGDRTAVLLAAWFHDAVYDGRPGAEERSAQWAERALEGVDVAAEVARLVRLTERHDPAPDDANGCLLCDADLGILAAGPTRYAEYAAAVRDEYAHVPWPDFAAGRGRILRDLLERPALFRTAPARDRWEGPARRNLADELRRLGQPARDGDSAAPPS